MQACKLGPWSSARQLVEARAAAADARRERLAHAAGEDAGAPMQHCEDHCSSCMLASGHLLLPDGANGLVFQLQRRTW